jgi:hypothetical protein
VRLQRHEKGRHAGTALVSRPLSHNVGIAPKRHPDGPAIKTVKLCALRREHQDNYYLGQLLLTKKNGSEGSKLIKANKRFVAALERAFADQRRSHRSYAGDCQTKKHPRSR